jgi:hypothetical protein
MADVKVSALASVTPTSDDKVLLVDDPGGTPSSKTATLAAVKTLFAVPTGALASLNSVAAGQIDSDAVTTVKILDSNVTTGKIADAAVTLAKQANLAADTIIGRANGGGTGVPQALTATQVRTVIGQALHKTDATADPVVGDDSADGYGIGSIWFNVSPSPRRVYICVDASVGAAVWVLLNEVSTAANVTLSDASKTVLLTSVAPFTDTALVVFDGDGGAVASSILQAAVTTLTDTQTLTNKTLTTPKIAQINDTNGNEQVVLTATGSSVNEIEIVNAATGNAPQIKARGDNTNVDLSLLAKGTGIVKGPLVAIPIAMSDRTTALTTGIKWTYYMPRAFTLVSMHGSVTTAPTGATLIVDVHKDGTTVMTTSKIVIDTTEFDTSTAATAPALTTTALSAGSKMDFEIDQIGSTVAGAGLTVTMLGYWT